MSGIDRLIDSIFSPISALLSAIVFVEIPVGGARVPVVVLWLMLAAIFFTVWLRFQPITGLRHSLQVIRGRFSRKTDPGEISSFQALATELSATVGLGNISGVAIGIVAGGPGAALWIALFGFLAMSVKLAEAALGARYRKVLEDGTTLGGPMYVLRDGLAEIGWKRLGVVLAGIYAGCALIGMLGGGNLFQANQVTLIVAEAFGEGSFVAENNWTVGVALAVLVGLVVLGGVTSIGRWTARITPFMAILYILSALAIIAVNITSVPAAIGEIVQGAISPHGVAGGAIGVAVIGIQRALFSNAAGVGTAAMSFSASKTRYPATEGYTAMWGPFVDSVVVCMLTAISIVVTGVHRSGEDADGVALTAQAFATVADWFPILLTVIVFLFGFSTMLSYSFFCEMLATYLFGPSRAVRLTTRVIYVLSVVVGASISMDSMVGFADATTFLVTIPNLLGLYILSRVLRHQILGHRIRVASGSIGEVEDPELRAGMGQSDPTPEQIATVEREDRVEAERIAALREELGWEPREG